MVFNGELEIGNTVHMEGLWFAFYEFIQSELDEVRAHWNSHYIRKSTFDTVPWGSEELLFLPESFGYEHRGIQSNDEDIAKALEEEDNFLLRAVEVIKAGDEELCDYFRYIKSQEGLNHAPRDWEGARELNKTLVSNALF